jgi:hypothetical protein
MKLLAAANCITIEEFLQRGRRRSKKLRSRGGFQSVSSLTHMNRHKQQTTPEKTKP